MNNKGFTLIEIIVGLAIISLISMAMLTVISNNFSFLNRSKEMSQDTFLSQQDIELEISSIKNELKESDHVLALDSVTIDGVDVDYHHVNKDYNNSDFQFAITPEQLPEHLLLKTFDVKATLKTDVHDAYSVYPIDTSSIVGSNTQDSLTFSTHWMKDIRQWYISDEGFNIPVPRGDGTDSDFRYYDYLVSEGLDSEIGSLYPLFPDDYKLLGTETEESLEDLNSYGGRHIIYKVTAAAKSGKLGIPEYSEPVHISGLKETDNLALHLDASYLDLSNSNDVSDDDKVIRWKDLSSGIEVASISENATSTNTSNRPVVLKTDPINDYSGQFVSYDTDLHSSILDQNTSSKFIYLYLVARGDEGVKILSNGSSKEISRSDLDENLVNEWYLIKDYYESTSDDFLVGESEIDVAEIIVYAYDDALETSEEEDLYDEVSKYIKNKYRVRDDIGEIEEVYDINKTVTVGDNYSPPLSALAMMSTGEERYVSITWEDDSIIDTSVPTTITRNGYATSNSDKEVQLTVVVTEYSMDIVASKFISESVVKVQFNEPITDAVDISEIEFNGSKDIITHAEQVSYDDQELLLFIKSNGIEYDGSSENKIKMFKGSIQHETEGEVKINQGEEFSLDGTNELVFYENFENFNGWTAYRSGNVKSSESPTNTSDNVLEKIDNSDPDGGHKSTDQIVNQQYILEGWLYRPTNDSGGYPGGNQERLAISDVSDNNKRSDGYGFGVTGNTIYIEKRSGNSEERISDYENFNRQDNQWYKFIFKGNSDNTYDLYVFDSEGNYQAQVKSTIDDEFENFDSIVIHGGHNYYVDDLKLFTY